MWLVKFGSFLLYFLVFAGIPYHLVPSCNVFSFCYLVTCLYVLSLKFPHQLSRDNDSINKIPTQSPEKSLGHSKDLISWVWELGLKTLALSWALTQPRWLPPSCSFLGPSTYSCGEGVRLPDLIWVAAVSFRTDFGPPMSETGEPGHPLGPLRQSSRRNGWVHTFIRALRIQSILVSLLMKWPAH